MEAPLALYRRYRPDTFDQVIGQDHVTGPLRAALRNNRVNHAYLFSGPRGCGKTTSARVLARALNCVKGPTDEPCGTCDSCLELATGGRGSVDVIEIDAASHGGVDDARELREQATFQPMRDRYKVYIIDEAHMVTTQGFNALLKIVEEPPEHVRFIFATTEPEKVIGTVRSRTHHYPFRLIPPKILSAYLRELCEREKVSIEPAALPLVVRAGGGSARDSLSILDQLIGGAGADGVTHALAAGLLGFTPDALLDEVIDAVAAHDGAGVFTVVDKVIETGQDPRRFTEDLLQRFRDLVVLSAVPEASASGLLDVPLDQGERLLAQAARFGRHDLSRAADLVAEALLELKGTTAPRLHLELLLARLLLPGADDRDRGLAARIDRLEKRLSMAPSSDAPAAERARPTRRSEGPSAPPPPPDARGPSPTASRTPDGEQAPPPEGPAGAASPSDRSTQQTRPARQQPPTAPPEPGPAPDPAPAAARGGALSLADLRRLWPDVVEAVKAQRRVTWIQLSQHAQVVGVEGETLTVGFNNVGARDSFLNGGSDTILQQVLIDLVGQAWKIEAILDPGGAPPSASATNRQAPREPSQPRPSARPQDQPTQDQPTQGQPTQDQPTQDQPTQDDQPAPPATSATPSQPPADAAAHPDDAADDDVAGAELLSQRLGAQVIEEIPHD